MARTDLLKRYLDAGMAFTAMTQARAEAIVRDLVRTGEVQADQAREAAADLLERSRRNTEQLLVTVRAEVEDQVGALEALTRKELARLDDRLDGLVTEVTARVAEATGTGTAPTSTGAAEKAAAKAPARKSAAKKSAAKRSAATKAPAKKAASKKAASKKAASKKAASKKRAGKKAASKKAAAKKAAG